jgi:hypothetical protein
MKTEGSNKTGVRLPPGEEALPAMYLEHEQVPPTAKEIQEAIASLLEEGLIEHLRDASGQPVFRPDSEGILQPVWAAKRKG